MSKVNGVGPDHSEQTATPHEEWMYDVYAAARDGILINLNKFMENKSITEVNDALNLMTEEEGLKATPLIIAAKNGHSSVVKELIEKYKVYKEQAGTFKDDIDIIEGVTALWSAVAFSRSMDTVKVLLELGADVNMVCPLRPAVYEGNLDMVKCLVENGAMVNTPSRYYNNTCLMLAASQNNDDDILSYLIEHGANIHAKDQEGKTVLHHAAEKGNFDVVRKLLDVGASHNKDYSRITPVQMACMNQREVAAKYIIDHVDMTPVEEIEALELLGASFQDCPNSNDTVYSYLLQGIEMRGRDSGNVVNKVQVPTCDEYDHRVEVQSVEEIKQIEENPIELNFQALLVKERILGEDNEFVQDSMIYVAGCLADSKKWPESVAILSRAIKLKIRNKYRVSGTLLYLCKLLIVSIDANEPPCATQVIEFINNCLEEMELENLRLLHAPLMKEQTECYYGIENIVMAFLQLQTIIMKLERPTNIDNDIYSAMRKFHEFDIRLKFQDMRTPLHILCSEEFEIDPCLFEEEVYVPHIGVLKVMFMNGVTADTEDNKGNTPLHLVFANSQANSNKKMLKEVVEMFFQAGARLDVKNCDNQLPLDMTNEKITKYLKGEFRKTRYKALFSDV